jgi:hypothetical protein
MTTQAPPLRQSRDTIGGVQQLQKRISFSKQCLGETTHLMIIQNKNVCVSVA